MGIPEILALIGPALQPYIGKGLETLSEEAGKTLWEAIKAPFRSKKERHIVEQVEKEPIPQDDGAALLLLIERKLDRDSEYNSSVLAALNAVHIRTEVHQHGDKSVSVQHNSGTINIQ